MGQRDLEAVALWRAWGAKVATSGADIAGVLEALGSPRVRAKKAPSRGRVELGHEAPSGQLTAEIRVDFVGMPAAEVEFHGEVHREGASLSTDTTSVWGSVRFGPKHVAVSWVHEGITKTPRHRPARERVPPSRSEDARGRRAHRAPWHCRRRQGRSRERCLVFGALRGEVRAAYARMGFALTRADGEPFSALDEEMFEAQQGPNAALPSGVRWRNARGDELDGSTLRFGGKAAARILW